MRNLCPISPLILAFPFLKLFGILKAMANVTLKLPGHQYDIRVEPGALLQMGSWVRAVAPHAQAALIADAAIEVTHGSKALASLRAAGYDVVTATMPSGEEHKTLDTARQLYEPLLQRRLDRKAPIIALGGGVTGDTVGFVAATYLRGVPFIQCPTTLLAMVDASVGGKVGVDVPQGKNLIGAFHQPHLVAIDTETLTTLPPRELRCGLAECVKHGVIRDEALFEWIGNKLQNILQLDAHTLVELVAWNVRIKANVVMADEKESGERAHLNFGHTFGHAIESTTGYSAFHHGEAISLGMVAAARLAVSLNRCAATVAQRIESRLQAIGLPTGAANLPPTSTLMDAMFADKKVAGGKLRLVLPTRMGAVDLVSDAPADAIVAAWDSLHA